MNILTLRGCFLSPFSLALRLPVQAGAAGLPHGERSQRHVHWLLPLRNLNNYPAKTRQVALLNTFYSSEYRRRSSRFLRSRAFRAGFQFFLTQPLNFETILNTAALQSRAN